MSRDRNTFAKRQRDDEKRRKAAEKRTKRAERQSSPFSMDNSAPDNDLSRIEESVMDVFREYLMTPGKMLCLHGQQLETFREPLAQLTEKGLLVAEQRHGGYSLTTEGYQVMTGRTG